MLFANAEVERLGPGTYAGLVKIDGTPVVILNGFHPRQLSFFIADDTVCAFLHASSPTGWEHAALRPDRHHRPGEGGRGRRSAAGCSPIRPASGWRR